MGTRYVPREESGVTNHMHGGGKSEKGVAAGIQDSALPSPYCAQVDGGSYVGTMPSAEALRGLGPVRPHRAKSSSGWRSQETPSRHSFPG